MKQLFLKFKKNLRFLRVIENFISNIPIGIVQIFYFLSSKYILKSKLLNYLGIQKVRIRLADFLLEKRVKSSVLRDQFQVGKKGEYFKKLRSDGVIEVPNALPDDVFDKLCVLVDGIKSEKTAYKHFVKAGAEYREVVIKNVDPELYSYLSQSFWVRDLAKLYLGKKRLKLEWRIKLVRDYDGTFDNNTLWHADTFFNTLKAFIYLNDVGSNKDVYNYINSSHNMDTDILDLHYRYSKNFNKQPWPSQEEVDNLNLPMFHKSIKANTMVLSDTRGLHRRRPKDKTDNNWRATLFCSFRSTPFTG